MVTGRRRRVRGAFDGAATVDRIHLSRPLPLYSIVIVLDCLREPRRKLSPESDIHNSLYSML
jgi:hypothetical protein